MVNYSADHLVACLVGRSVVDWVAHLACHLENSLVYQLVRRLVVHWAARLVVQKARHLAHSLDWKDALLDEQRGQRKDNNWVH